MLCKAVGALAGLGENSSTTTTTDVAGETSEHTTLAPGADEPDTLPRAQEGIVPITKTGKEFFASEEFRDMLLLVSDYLQRLRASSTRQNRAQDDTQELLLSLKDSSISGLSATSAASTARLFGLDVSQLATSQSLTDDLCIHAVIHTFAGEMDALDAVLHYLIAYSMVLYQTLLVTDLSLLFPVKNIISFLMAEAVMHIINAAKDLIPGQREGTVGREAGVGMHEPQTTSDAAPSVAVKLADSGSSSSASALSTPSLRDSGSTASAVVGSIATRLKDGECHLHSPLAESYVETNTLSSLTSLQSEKRPSPLTQLTAGESVVVSTPCNSGAVDSGLLTRKDAYTFVIKLWGPIFAKLSGDECVAGAFGEDEDLGERDTPEEFELDYTQFFSGSAEGHTLRRAVAPDGASFSSRLSVSTSQPYIPYGQKFSGGQGAKWETLSRGLDPPLSEQVVKELNRMYAELAVTMFLGQSLPQGSPWHGTTASWHDSGVLLYGRSLFAPFFKALSAPDSTLSLDVSSFRGLLSPVVDKVVWDILPRLANCQYFIQQPECYIHSFNTTLNQFNYQRDREVVRSLQKGLEGDLTPAEKEKIRQSLDDFCIRWNTTDPRFFESEDDDTPF